MRVLGIVLLVLFSCANSFAAKPGYEDSLRKAEKHFERGIRIAEKAWRKNSPKLVGKSKRNILPYRKFFSTAPTYYYAMAKLTFLEGNEVMAFSYLDTAVSFGHELSQADFFIRARGLHLQSRWSGALDGYESFLRKPGAIGRRYLRLAEQGRSQVRLAFQLLQKPGRARLDSLSMAPFNRSGREFTPLVSADERIFIFLREPDSSAFRKGRVRSGDALHCICVEGGQTTRLPDYLCRTGLLPVSLSPDGSRLILKSVNRKGRLDLWVSDRYDGYFQRPQPFPEGINSAYNESQASFASDNKSLYFVSDRPGGIGGKDIYFSQLNEAGVWSSPRNLGPVVNTSGDEHAVFMHPDGRFLYFSSDGHPGIGGADWFVARSNMGRYSDVQHLGIPINTPYSDKHLVLSGSSKFALMDGSVHESTGRQDLRKVLLQGQEKVPMLAEVFYSYALLDDVGIREAVGEEQCFDCSSLILVDLALEIPLADQPVFSGGRVLVYDLALGQLFYDGFFGPSESAVHLVLPAGREYGVVVAAEGYYPFTLEMMVPDGSPFRKERIPVVLTRPNSVAPFDLLLVRFIDGSTSLPLSSRAGLQVLWQFMEDHPDRNVRVGIRSPRLQELQVNERLDAVKRFLLEKGISPKRIGEDLPAILDSTTSSPHLVIQVTP